MGKRRKGGDAPQDTWASKSPQQKADAFDASHARHSGKGVPPLPEPADRHGGDVGIPASGPSVPDDE